MTELNEEIITLDQIPNECNVYSGKRTYLVQYKQIPTDR